MAPEAVSATACIHAMNVVDPAVTCVSGKDVWPPFSRGFYGGMGYSGDSAMRQLTEDTGGRVIEVGNKPEKLKAAFDQIANELRSQYGIGYTPTNLKKDGTFRKIEVRTKEGYKVQARRGYYAIQQE